MSTQETRLREIADAIRAKEGSTELIPANAFASRILALEMSRLPEGTHTINLQASDPEGGTVVGGGVASDGMKVTVNAEVGDGYKFVKWEESGQAVNESTSYSFIVNRNRALTAVFEVKTSRLPEGYIEVEYIYTTDRTIIQTNFTPNISQTKIVSEWKLNQIFSEKEGNSILGGNMSTGQYFLRFPSETSIVRRFQAAVGGSSTYTIPSVLNRKIEITVDYTSRTFYVDNMSFSMGTVNTPAGPLNLFNNYAIARYGAVGRCYFCKIYSGAVLTADFVPCINPSGQAGLYDTIGNTFYTSLNPEFLLAGPAI